MNFCGAQLLRGRRQAVKQGRRAKRQRPCCKLHPSAVEPFVEVLA